jgi:hypothetical protein
LYIAVEKDAGAAVFVFQNRCLIIGRYGVSADELLPIMTGKARAEIFPKEAEL